MPQRSIQCVLASLASQHQARPVSIALYHCAAHCCVFTVNNPPPTPPPPTPDTHQLPPHIKPCTNTHCTSACWVMLTGCAGCLCENWRGVLGQWARARFLLTPGYVLHPRQLFVTGFFLRRHKLPFFFSPLEVFAHARYQFSMCKTWWKNCGLNWAFSLSVRMCVCVCVHMHELNVFHLTPLSSWKQLLNWVWCLLWMVCIIAWQ